jgi:hypothetical protein
MQITYSKGYIPTPKLRELDQGEVFRPKNSQRVYMPTAYTGMDDIFSNTAFEDYVLNVQNFDFDDCPPNADELRACINLVDGTIVFFHLDIEVRVLECELNIVEEE